MLKHIIVVFIASLFLSTPLFAQEVSGVVMVVKGDVKITSKDGKTESAKVGKKVFPGDTIVAAAEGRAKIVMSDKNVLNVSPDSKIVIEKYENDGKDKKNVELNVLYGKVRASVEQKYDGDKSKFNIKTPSAVAGVRGTDFMTSFNAGTKTAQVITFSGTVAVGTPGPGGSIQNPVFVQPGQMTTASAGAAPEAPKAVPKEELQQMNNETKAETAKGGPESSGNQAAAEEKKEEKKEEAKKEEVKSEEKKEAASEKKEDSGGKKEAANDKKEDGGSKKEASPDKKEAAADKGPTKSEQASSPGSDAKSSAPAGGGETGSNSAGATSVSGNSTGGSSATSDSTRSPSSIAPSGPPASSGSSMISTSDLGPAVGSGVSLRPIAAPAPPMMINNPVANLPAPPVTVPVDVIRNTKSRVQIIIKPPQ